MSFGNPGSSSKLPPFSEKVPDGVEDWKVSKKKIRPATAKDLTQLTEICCAAFMDDPLYSWLHPRRKQYFHDFKFWKYLIICTLFYGSLAKFYVLEFKPWTDKELEVHPWLRDHVEIYGYVMLQAEDKKELEKVKKERSWIYSLLHLFYGLASRLYVYFEMGGSLDYAALREYNTKADKTNLFPPDLGPHFDLMDLAVLPKEQGRGYGSLLLKHCISIASEANMPIALECAPEKRYFYEKHGFRQRVEDWSYVLWSDFPRFVEGIGLIWEKMPINPQEYADKLRHYRPRRSRYLNGLMDEMDEVVDVFGRDAGLRKRNGVGDSETKVDEYGNPMSETTGTSTTSTIFSAGREAGSEKIEEALLGKPTDAGLRSPKRKGEREAKVDEHGRSLPKAIDSPVSSTGLFPELEKYGNYDDGPFGKAKPSSEPPDDYTSKYYPDGLENVHFPQRNPSKHKRVPIPEAWRTDKSSPGLKTEESESAAQQHQNENNIDSDSDENHPRKWAPTSLQIRDSLEERMKSQDPLPPLSPLSPSVWSAAGYHADSSPSNVEEKSSSSNNVSSPSSNDMETHERLNPTSSNNASSPSSDDLETHERLDPIPTQSEYLRDLGVGSVASTSFVDLENGLPDLSSPESDVL